MMAARDPDLLSGESIVCFASEDWWYHNRQSTAHLMQAFARNGNRVLFVNCTGLRSPSAKLDPFAWKRVRNKLSSFARLLGRVEPRLYVFTPIALPVTVRGRKAALWLNRVLLPLQMRVLAAVLRLRRPILWVANPAMKDVATGLRRTWAKCMVYYCVDNFPSLPGADRAFVELMDRGLQETADFTLFTGRKLFEERRNLHPRTFLLPHGVDFGHFAPAARPLAADAAMPPDLRGIPRPIAACMGAVRDLDVDLIHAVAVANPGVSIVLIGGVYAQTGALAGLPNVFLLGKKDYSLLPRYLAAAQCCCVFYKTGDGFNDYRSPKKLLEYLATGQPVVSVPLRELDAFRDCVYIGHSPEEFSAHVRAALEEREGWRRERRIHRAACRDWSVVAREATQLILQALEEGRGRAIASAQRAARSA
jgi:glycosyltransferase involved in cell wall biosynthesis